MADPNTPLPLTASRLEEIFQILTSAQIARVRNISLDCLNGPHFDRLAGNLPMHHLSDRVIDRLRDLWTVPKLVSHLNKRFGLILDESDELSFDELAIADNSVF